MHASEGTWSKNHPSTQVKNSITAKNDLVHFSYCTGLLLSVSQLTKNTPIGYALRKTVKNHPSSQEENSIEIKNDLLISPFALLWHRVTCMCQTTNKYIPIEYTQWKALLWLTNLPSVGWKTKKVTKML